MKLFDVKLSHFQMFKLIKNNEIFIKWWMIFYNIETNKCKYDNLVSIFEND